MATALRRVLASAVCSQEGLAASARMRGKSEAVAAHRRVWRVMPVPNERCGRRFASNMTLHENCRPAAAHNMEIVQVYSDHGRSGLNTAGREGLNQLMSDVENKQANFSALLVYDVSRWGRFQDVDESAYYEYVLKRAGIRVHYCAEQFENDGSMSSSVLKTLKRSMAAEYSRELSVKVFSSQCRLIELGFQQGGPAGYGLMERMYISGIVHLVEHEEVALIEAVEAGRLPISVAVQIAN